MRSRLEDIAAEFERLSMDERLRFEMRNASGIEVVLAFRRVDARPWSMWFTGQEQQSKQICTRSHLQQAALAFALDPGAVSRELGQCLILQAAYAGEFVRQVAQIVGQEDLEEGLKRTRDFMDGLARMVQEAVRGEERTIGKPAAAAQSQEDEGPALVPDAAPSRRPQLRIIKP